MQATAKQSKYRLHEAKMLQQDSANSNYQPLNLGFRPRKCYTRHAALLGNASAPLVQNVMPDIRLISIMNSLSYTWTSYNDQVCSYNNQVCDCTYQANSPSCKQCAAEVPVKNCVLHWAIRSQLHLPPFSLGLTSHSLCAFYVLKEPQKRNEEIMANFKHLTGSKKNTCFKAHRIP